MKNWLAGAVCALVMGIASWVSAEGAGVNEKLQMVFVDDFGGTTMLQAIDYAQEARQGMVLIASVARKEKELKDQIETIISRLAMQYGIEKGNTNAFIRSMAGLPVPIATQGEESLRAMVVQIRDMSLITKGLKERKISYLILVPKKMEQYYRYR